MKPSLSLIKIIAREIAKPLSPLLSSPNFYSLTSSAEAYLAFLLGKGAGRGWDLEGEVKAASETIFSSNPVVFDIGAHQGEWSKFFLMRNPNTRLFLVEPDQACQAIIRNLNLPNSTLIPFAVSQEQGTSTLYSFGPGDSGASLHKQRYFHEQSHDQCSVQTTTIDRLIDDFSLEFIDFIKMDIEGHELDALRGATKSLSQRKIGALSFEFGLKNLDSRTFFSDFWDLLTSNGFQLYCILAGGKLLQISNYSEELEYFRGCSNYIAQLKEHPSTK
jgi:FkbM family methyltransferase